jgi:hypothetical protein
MTIEEVRAEGDLPVAGYEPSPVNGAFVQNSNGHFRLQFGAYTQVRWTANWRDAPTAESDDPAPQDFTRGWSLNRTRLFLEGKYTDRTAFHFRGNVNDSFDMELLAAWAQLRLGNGWNLRVGKQFIPLSREDWMLPQDLLRAEFSPNDFTFAIGPSLGAFVSHEGTDHRVWISLHNGAFGGRDTFPAAESDVAATVRWEWNFVGDDWSVWEDVVGRPGRPRALLLGLSGGYQTKVAEAIEQPDAAGQINADLSLNGDGYQVMFAGSGTWIDPVNDDAYTHWGMLAQGGYFVGRGSQVFAQYNLVHPGSQPGDLEPFHSLAAGYNYFPYVWTNRWKLSAELAYQFSAMNRTIVAPSGPLGWLESDEARQVFLKLQMQFGF